MEFTDFDMECLPALGFYKSKEEIAEKCFLKFYEYLDDRQGWYGDYLLSSRDCLPVLMHGFVETDSATSRIAKMGKVKKLVFHHAKKAGSQDVVEPWLEIWLDEEN